MASLRCAASTCARAAAEARAAAGRERCGGFHCDAPAERAVYFFRGEARSRRLGGRVRHGPARQRAAAGRRGGVGVQVPRSRMPATDVSSEIAFSCEITRRSRARDADAWPKRPERAASHLMNASIFDLSSGGKRWRLRRCGDAPARGGDGRASANLDGWPPLSCTHHHVETLLHRGVTVVVSRHRVHYLADLAGDDEALLLRAGARGQRSPREKLARLTPGITTGFWACAHRALDEVRANAARRG